MSSPKARKKGKRAYGTPLSSLDRKVGGRTAYSVVLILSEGEKTEPLYFNALCRDKRLSSVRVKVVGVGVDPTQLVREADKRRAALKIELGKDTDIQVWCVFDCEGLGASVKVEEAIRYADQIGVELAISNPAFELWYLLHLINSSKPFQKAIQIIHALQPLLKAQRLPPYTKTNPRIYEYLKMYQADAIQRAMALCAYDAAMSPQERCPNPSTGVYRLVQYLLTLKF